MKKDFSCGGIVWDEEKRQLLLVQVENLSKERVWTFPKGHPENGESDEAAALREVREETGWECVVRNFLMDVQYFYTDKKERIHKTVRWFVMKPVAQKGSFQEEEIEDCRWVSLEEAEKLISYESDKTLLANLKIL